MADKVEYMFWDNESHRVSFYCPGCGELHAMPVDGDASQHPIWQWNGSLDKPTLSPSILMKSGHYAHTSQKCWCSYNAEHPDEPAPFGCVICHSFVRDGRIEFLSDCTHALAGQTVELPDIEPVSIG